MSVKNENRDGTFPGNSISPVPVNCPGGKRTRIYNIPFGNKGQLHTIYDARQGPIALLVEGTAFSVFYDEGKGEVDNFKTNKN